MTQRIDSSEFHQPTLTVAQRLLGKLLVRNLNGQRLSGIVVETEAYLSENDPASHSFVGLKKRNAAMFKPAGTLYVYSIHAKYCLNVVTEEEGIGAAVLIRALQPWEGLETMQAHRNSDKLRDLCTGPARLCQALAIATVDDGIDLKSSDEVWLEPPPKCVLESSWQTTMSSRIGISSAQELPYRFFIDGHGCVSGLARLHNVKRGWRFTA